MGPDSIKLNPYFLMSQNYSAESLVFFVKIFYELGQVGKVSVYLNDYNKVMIRYRADGWKSFFNVFIPYFNMLYGDKFMTINILQKVYELSSSNLIADKILIINLIYSLPTSGIGRSLSLAQKLELLNLNYEPSQVNIPMPGVEDNSQNITLFFFIGFFLGDGFLSLIPVWSETHTRLMFNPRLVITQKAKNSNINLMNKIKSFLESFLNVDVLLYVDKSGETEDVGVFRLTVQGQHNVLELILNALAPHCEYLYWKKSQYGLLTWFKSLYDSGFHLQLFIIRIILEKLYENKPTLSGWLERLDKIIDKLESRLESNHLYIIYAKNRNSKENVGLIVSFPRSLKIPNKQFTFSVYGSERKALDAAILHRDSIIKEISKKFNP